MNKSTGPIQVVFFDLGNVLVHLHLHRFFERLAILADITVEQAMLVAQDHDKAVDEFNRGIIDGKSFYHTVTSQLNQVPFDEFNTIYTDIFSPNTFMLNIAKAIKAETRISIISNTDPLHYRYIDKQYGFLQLFESPVTSYNAHSLKPEPQIYQYALKELQIKAEQAIFIDDLQENIAAACTLGINGIQYTDNNTLIHDLSNYGFNNLKQFLEV